MVNILITGSKGQLGNEIRTASINYPHFNFIFTDIHELDITDYGKIEDFYSRNNIDVIINCAAYTAVDRAEEEPDLARLINSEAVANLVSICKKYETFLVHVSTDYVFDGKGNRPYREDDHTNPATIYGKSKLAGEQAILSCLQKGLIIRTSWLYSSFGTNFIKTILKKGSDTGKLAVVNDQVGCPTYARDLAVTILDILPEAWSSNEIDLYHYSNEGSCSWFEFARSAVELAKIPCQVEPISSAQYPQKAPRPQYSVFDKSRIKARFGITIPAWKDSLEDCVEAWRRGIQKK